MGGNHIRARNWLNKMGIINAEVKKGVFVDVHERKDVVDYRDNIFLPAWQNYERRMVVFSGDGTWKLPPSLRPGERPVLVTHYE